jgi:ferredoxin
MGSAIAALSVACVKTETEVTIASANAHPHAAQVWAAKCSSCHVRVEPGTRQRSEIEAALARHRTRAKLTEGEWAELADFLAPTGSVAMATPAAQAR